MKIYLVGIETSFDYRKFPWIKKSRGFVSLKANLRTIVAENAEEVEQKYRDSLQNKCAVWNAVGLLAEGGFSARMCKEPNMKHQPWAIELDATKPLGEYLQYMSASDLALLKEG